MLAGWLTACDPTSYPYLAVKGVSVFDKKPYLRVSILSSWGPGCCGENPNNYYVSQDGGNTWQELTTHPEYLPDNIWLPTSSQTGECVPNDPHVCYRLNGKPEVEISTDDGKSWQIDWKMPPGRQLYMARDPVFIDLIEVFPDTIPYDLGILETETGYVVIVAYGNQGLLVRSTSGTWERYPIQMEPKETYANYFEEIFPALPLPYRATSVGDLVLALASETGWIFLLALTWLMLLHTTGWVRLSKGAEEWKRGQIAWLVIFSVILGAAFGLQLWIFISIHLHGTPRDYWDVKGLFQCLCLPLAILAIIVFVATWEKLPYIKAVTLVSQRALKWSLIFFGLVWMPFGLWALGIIPHYLSAQIGAGLMGLLTIFLGLRAEKHLVQHLLSQLPVETQDEPAAQEVSET